MPQIPVAAREDRRIEWLTALKAAERLSSGCLQSSHRKYSKVISSNVGLRWWGRYAEERRENREQLMRVRHGLNNFSLIIISLGASDRREECRQERLV